MGYTRLSSILLLAAGPALAANATVSGTVVVGKVPSPPPRNLGYLPPAPNPIVDPRQVDALPEVFVFLDGGPVAADASQAPHAPLTWALSSNSFDPPILPVVDGTTVEIDNKGRDTHLLYVADAKGTDPLAGKPIGPSASATLTVTGAPMEILSQVSPHIDGRVVALPSKYFARPDRHGKFHIDNVPPGHWTAKVWFRDGWVARTFPVEVPAKGDVKLELPDLTAGAK